MSGDNEMNRDDLGSYMALLTTPPLTPHNNHRPASRRSKTLSTIEHHPTGLCGRRLGHEDHHVLHGVADLCDLCILIICVNVRIRHVLSLYETHIYL
jgi:hypothetical protein